MYRATMCVLEFSTQSWNCLNTNSFCLVPISRLTIPFTHNHTLPRPRPCATSPVTTIALALGQVYVSSSVMSLI